MEKQGFDLAMHYFRAFAIFSVISVHMWIVPPLEGHESMSRFLDMLRGVLFHSSTLYFVFISGYLFHFLAQRKFDLRTYYRKKLLNVIVPYVILSVFFTGYAFFWYSYTGEVPRFTKLVTGCREFFQALLYGDVVLTYWYIPFIATIFLVSPLLLRLSEERFALLTLFTVWIPLLSRTLDLTYPPLLVIQVPLYLFPLCRGYHWGVTPVTVRHLHGAGEYMGLYGLFYLIVASFAPQLLDRVPVLLALLALDLLAVVGMRTSGRNTIRAGSPFGRLPVLLVPAVLALLAVAACALLLAARGELIPIFQAVGSLLEGALIAVFRFLTSLFQGRSAGSAGMSSAAGGGSEAALPVESASGPAIAPQLVTALLLLSLAALVLAGVAALVRWLWRSRSRIRLPEEDDDDGLVRQRLGRRGLLSRLGQRLRVRAFLLRYAGTPRAALLELEHWGARRRCRRQSQETPREYLERLAGGPLRDALDAPMQARYSILVDDVERSLYSTLPPRLSREQVRELLSTVHRSARTPPARAK